MKKTNASRYDEIFEQAMEAGFSGTTAELAAIIGCGLNAARARLKNAVNLDRMHISKWVGNARGVLVIPFYAQGSGDDAKKPELSNSDRSIRLRECERERRSRSLPDDISMIHQPLPIPFVRLGLWGM